MTENQSETTQNGNRNLIIGAIVILVLMIIGVVALIIWMGGSDQEGGIDLSEGCLDQLQSLFSVRNFPKPTLEPQRSFGHLLKFLKVKGRECTTLLESDSCLERADE